jgi:hypothetical protein
MHNKLNLRAGSAFVKSRNLSWRLEMRVINTDPQQQSINHSSQCVYEAPAIIYEGTITTRAGSQTGGPAGSGESGVDPADLFGNDD